MTARLASRCFSFVPAVSLFAPPAVSTVRQLAVVAASVALFYATDALGVTTATYLVNANNTCDPASCATAQSSESMDVKDTDIACGFHGDRQFAKVQWNFGEANAYQFGFFSEAVGECTLAGSAEAFIKADHIDFVTMPGAAAQGQLVWEFKWKLEGYITIVGQQTHEGFVKFQGGTAIDLDRTTSWGTPEIPLKLVATKVITLLPNGQDGEAALSVEFQSKCVKNPAVGKCEANFNVSTLTLESIALPDGTTPEELGMSVIFDSGLQSPNPVVELPSVPALSPGGTVFLGSVLMGILAFALWRRRGEMT